MIIDDKELNKRFSHHPPRNEEEIKIHECIREECKRLAMFLNGELSPSRESSLAFTALEEVMMWANAAFARNKV